MDAEDPVISRLPILLSTKLDPLVQLHQFPLLNRPLEAPPSALLAGKHMSARVKPISDRIEVHIPVDTREDVWNKARGLEFGQARSEEDGKKASSREERRLEETRLQSDRVPEQGVYMLGVVKDNQLHLHPISSVYKFRPNLNYVDVAATKGKRRQGGEEEEPLTEAEEEEQPKGRGEAKEVQVSARKASDAKFPTGMSDMRRDLLRSMRAEESEEWKKLKYHNEDASTDLREKLLSHSQVALSSDSSTMASLLEGIS